MRKGNKTNQQPVVKTVVMSVRSLICVENKDGSVQAVCCHGASRYGWNGITEGGNTIC